MNIAITGGSGLIGSELSRLFTREHNIIILDFKEPKDTDISFRKVDIESYDQVVDATKKN